MGLMLGHDTKMILGRHVNSTRKIATESHQLGWKKCTSPSDLASLFGLTLFLTGGEKSSDGLRKRWDEVSEAAGELKKNWNESRKLEKGEDEARLVGKSWEKQRRSEKTWGEGGEMEQLWELLAAAAVEKSCKNWDELRWSEKTWRVVVAIEKGGDKMTSNSKNRVAKLWEVSLQLL